MTPCRVLHVLPHAGAGAQTYIDVLADLEGLSFETFELSASRSATGAIASIAARQPALWRAASGADLIHLHGEVASLIALPLLLTRPSVVTLHGLHLLRRLRPGVPQTLGRGALRTIVAGADRTICVSEAERQELRWLPELTLAKLVVVRNGLKLPPETEPERRDRARAALGLGLESIAVLYLGQLEPRKDPMTAARAVRHANIRDPRIVLLIAGDGPCMPDLRQLTGDGLRLLGQRRDAEDLLAAADVFVMPSLREGLSYAVLEALGHGVATIVSDAPGNTEAVGDAGLVFASGNDGELSTLLLELSADAKRRAELAARGRDRIADHLGADQMLRGTRAVYESVLRAPGRPAAGALA